MPKKQETKSSLSFEANMSRLEEIAAALDSGGIPLEDALALYEEGIALAKVCAAKLAHVEKKLYELSKDAEGLFTLTEIHEDDE